MSNEPVVSNRQREKLAAIERLRKDLVGHWLAVERINKSENYSIFRIYVRYNMTQWDATLQVSKATGFRFDRKHEALGYGGDTTKAVEHIANKIRQVLDMPNLEIVEV